MHIYLQEVTFVWTVTEKRYKSLAEKESYVQKTQHCNVCIFEKLQVIQNYNQNNFEHYKGKYISYVFNLYPGSQISDRLTPRLAISKILAVLLIFPLTANLKLFIFLNFKIQNYKEPTAIQSVNRNICAPNDPKMPLNAKRSKVSYICFTSTHESQISR